MTWLILGCFVVLVGAGAYGILCDPDIGWRRHKNDEETKKFADFYVANYDKPQEKEEDE